MTARPVRLADLAEIFDGPHATPKRRETGPYFLNISSLLDGRLDLSQSDHVSREDFSTWTRRVTPEAGDLLFSYETRLGEAALMPDDVEACLGRRMALLRPNRERVDPRFLLYCYLGPTFRTLIERHTIPGATVNRIGLSSMGSWDISVPGLQEQRAIAEVLGALDDKIAANTRLAGVADEYLGTVFARDAEACTERRPLRELAEVNAESLKPTPGGSLRYIDIASVGVGRFEYPELTSWDDAPGRARRKVRRGDVLWSTVRPNRRSHALNLADEADLVGSTGLAVLSPVRVGFAYLYEVTRLPEFTAYLEGIAEGSAYPAVRGDRFGDALIPWLAQSKRDAFEAVGTPMREHVHSLEAESRLLAGLRDVLLPQLMSGKIRVKDAEDRVGEVL